MACRLFRCRGVYGCVCVKPASEKPTLPPAPSPANTPAPKSAGPAPAAPAPWRGPAMRKRSPGRGPAPLAAPASPPAAPTHPKPEVVSEDAESGSEEVFKIFQYFDQDANGQIDRGELTSVLSKLDWEYWDVRRIRALFRAADVDRDQMISLKEFLDWIFKRGAEQHALRTSLPALERLEEIEVRKEKIKKEHVFKLTHAAQTPSDFAAAKAQAAPFFTAEEMRSLEQQFREKQRFYFECSVKAATGTAASWDFEHREYRGCGIKFAKERARPFFTADEMRSQEEQYRERMRSIYKDKLMAARSLDAFDHIRKNADFAAFFTPDEMRSHEVQFTQSMRSDFRARFMRAQSCAAFRGIMQSLMVDALFSADEIKNFNDEFKQSFIAKNLEVAESATALSAAMKEATTVENNPWGALALRPGERKQVPVFEPHELAKYEKQLETLRLPFLLTISTLAGSTCTVEARREQRVQSLCLQVASQLGVDPKFHKVLLVHAGGRLEPDHKPLEACGVVSSDVQLAAQLSLTREGEARERKLEEERAAEEQRRRETEERRAAAHGKQTARFEALTFDELVTQAKHVGLLQEADVVPGHQRVLLTKHLSLASVVEECEADLWLWDSRCADLESQMKSLAEANEHIEKQKIQPIIDEWSPILDPAMLAVKQVTAKDLDDIKKRKNPPREVLQTFTALCILFQLKPCRIKDDCGRMATDYWRPSVQLLGNPSLIQSLQDYDKDNILPPCIKLLTQHAPEVVDDADSTLEKAKEFSKASGAICMWVCAIYQYSMKTSEASAPFCATISENNTLMNAAQEQLRSHQEERQQVLGDLNHFRKALQGQAPLRNA